MYIYRCPFCGLWRIKPSGNVSLYKLQKAFNKGWREEDTDYKPKKLTFDSIDFEHEPMVIEKKGKAIIGKWNIYEAFLNLPDEEKEFLLKKLVEILQQCSRIRKIAEEVFNIKLTEEG